jgi:hypothetical protein
MPKGAIDRSNERRGCGCVVSQRSVRHPDSRARRVRQPERGPALVRRAQRRRFSVTDLRPADQAGQSVLSHVWGEPSGPLVGTIGLPA